MDIDSILCREIIGKLNELPKSERGRIIREYLPIMGCGEGTLFKELKKHGYDSGKNPRKDKGKRKVPITDDQLRMIAGAIKKSKRKKRRPTMPTTVAVEIAAQAGVIPPEMADKVATINRLLRQQKTSKRHMMQSYTTDDHKIPAFYTPLVSEHPNEWHCFDTTPCTQYYFNKKGLRQRDENLQLYGGKLKYYKETKEHLLRYVIVDHKTDMFFFKYFYAKGEDVNTLVEFLYQAWALKEDTLYPFQGVPFNLYLDKGSANLSQYIQNMCKNLRINLHSHKAGNPRAKGKVEGYMKIIQEQFESRLSLQSATSLEEINKQAYAWMVHYCAIKKHRRTKLCRTAFWMSITNEQLRKIPNKQLFLKTVRSKPFIAVVSSAKTILVDGKEYLINGNVLPDDRVICDRDHYNPLALYAYKLNEDKTRGEQLSIILIPKNKYGESAFASRLGREYKRHEDTITTTEMKAMDKLDYTAMAKAAFADKRGEIEKLAYIERQGTEIVLAAGLSPTQIRETQRTQNIPPPDPLQRGTNETQSEIAMFPRHDVFKEIRFRLRVERILPVQAQFIEEILGTREQVEDAVIEEICAMICRGGVPPPIPGASSAPLQVKEVATA